MNLFIRMRIIYNVRHPYAMPLKFEDKFLTFPIKLALGVKASICSIIKDNLILYCRKFSAFVADVII